MGNLLKYIFLKNTYAIGTTGREHRNESEKKKRKRNALVHKKWP